MNAFAPSAGHDARRLSHRIQPRTRQLIFYEDLVEEPMQQIAAIYAFLGLPGFNKRIARQIHARSIHRRTPPGISPAIAELCNKLYIKFAAARNAHTV